MGIFLNRDSSVPLYLQLSEGLVQEIQKGNLLVSTMLPPERTLMKDYGLSRATVRQALTRLSDMGYLRKEQGRGSFITMPGASSALGSFHDFAEEMQALGKKGHTDLLFFRIVLCYPELTSILGLTAKDYVFKFIRLHFADDVPVLLETTYLPYSSFESLNREDLKKAPLHEIIMVWFRKAITRTDESFDLVQLGPEEASLLMSGDDETAMRRRRLSFAGEQAIEYTTSLTVGQRITFRTVTKPT